MIHNPPVRKIINKSNRNPCLLIGLLLDEALEAADEAEDELFIIIGFSLFFSAFLVATPQ
jgi:hypothetical protein